MRHKTLGILLLVGLLGVWLLDKTHPLNLPEKDQLFARIVVDSEGRPLRAFADEQGIWRYPVTLDQVSPLYIEALLHYEDQWFWHHPGINPLALIRAAYLNIKHQRIVSGGSTLSMQVARLLHPHSRSVWGKVTQTLRTFQLEWHLSKKQILTLYCNIAPFGGTIEGVQAASFTYLNKPAKELSHAEAALLAVLPQSPTRYRPDIHSPVAETARNKVLDRLAAMAVWPHERVAQAKIEPVYAYRARHEQHASLLARRLLKNSDGQTAIESTIDGDLQRGLEDYLKHYITRFPEHTSAAILVVDNASAEVKAYLGAADFANEQRFGHVDMVQATRSPGSTLKPFLYAMAMDAGHIHAKSLLADVPRTWGTYRPGNFNQRFSGAVSVTGALQRSLNLPAIEVLARLGESKFVAGMNHAGVKLSIPGGRPNLSVILGGAGTSLEKLVKGYVAFANHGRTRDLHFVRQNKPSAPERFLMSKQSAWIVQNILSEVSRPGQLHTLANTRSGQYLAWKTGTSYGFRDTWAIGLNRQYTIGVWLGRPDGTPIPGNSGRSSAGPLLHAVADHIGGQQHQNIPMPEAVVLDTICWPLGILKKDQSSEHCHREHKTWLIRDVIPPTWHVADGGAWQGNLLKYWINPVSKKRVMEGCKVSQKVPTTVAVWPKVLDPWVPWHYRRHQLIPGMDKRCAKVLPPVSSQVQIVGIESGNVYRSPSPADPVPSLILKAIGGEGRYHWYINGEYRFSSGNGAATPYTLGQRGKYQVVVVDDVGTVDKLTIEVI